MLFESTGAWADSQILRKMHIRPGNPLLKKNALFSAVHFSNIEWSLIFEESSGIPKFLLYLESKHVKNVQNTRHMEDKNE